MRGYNNNAKSTQSVSMKKVRNKKKKGTYISGRSGGFEFSSTAASYDVSLSNPTRFKIRGDGLKHSEFGPALRCEGRQQLVKVTTTASDSTLFVNGLATTHNANSVLISPFFLNDRIAAFGAIYQRFAFREIRFIFVTRVGTTQVGSFALSYNSDSGMMDTSSLVALNYANIQSIDPCKIIPFRKECEVLDVRYGGDRTWYCEADTNSISSMRQCQQGILVGYPDVTSIGATNQGEIFIEYIVDFYVPSVLDPNVTLLKNVKGSSELIKQILEVLNLLTTQEEKSSFMEKVSRLIKELGK